MHEWSERWLVLLHSVVEKKWNDIRCVLKGREVWIDWRGFYFGCKGVGYLSGYQDTIVGLGNVLIQHQMHDMVLIWLFDFVTDMTVSSQSDG